MRRREFITLIGSAAATWPLATHAQQLDKARLIGVLMGFAESDSIAQSRLTAFRDALTKLGWMEGTNLRVELRWGADDPDRMRAFAKELVDLGPDAIVAHSLLVHRLGPAGEPHHSHRVRERLRPDWLRVCRKLSATRGQSHGPSVL